MGPVNIFVLQQLWMSFYCKCLTKEETMSIIYDRESLVHIWQHILGMYYGTVYIQYIPDPRKNCQIHGNYNSSLIIVCKHNIANNLLIQDGI